jgi:murein DD-endopeptidase MepM/ murein hydrolase activator NlpD
MAYASRTVRVESGDTVYSLARKHDVTASAILKANDLPRDTRLRIGQSITIPGNGPAVRVAEATSIRKTATDAAPVVRGAPPSNLGTLPATREGKVIAGPATAAAEVRPAAKVASIEANPAPVAPKADKVDSAPAVVARVEPAEKAPAAAKSTVADTADAASADGQQFRWPVRGRIISGFGSKPGGEKNDGINLAVPEGTSVKAAEAGTVIYSGNEIAGYGNLILIRHAGGWVTAYAHTSTMLVKRGDVVKRGQTIANAGSTGNVTSPQLHFELRRGSNPVNPMDYLAGA